MGVTAALAIGALASAGATAYSASQAKKSGGGGLPSVQKYKAATIPYQDIAQVNPVHAYTDSLKYNENLLPYDENLSNQVNQYQYANAHRYYNKIQPYFSNLQSQIGQNALSLEKGQLPPDVLANIQRNAASQGISNGFGFGAQGGQTGFLANLNLRNLGLTSLNAMQMGNQLGLQANQEAKNLLPQFSSPTDFFINPNTLIGAGEFNAGQFNSILGKNYDYLNQAAAANAGAVNAAAQYNSQAANAANLASAGIQSQGISQLTSILGKYLSNSSSGGGGLGGASSFNAGSAWSGGAGSADLGTAIGAAGF